MANVTGTLTDLGLQAMPGLHPELGFRADPGIDGSAIRFDREIRVTPSSLGAFSVNLAPTDTLRPATYYRITVRWLDPGGNFIGFNEIPGKLYVPAAGGQLASLLVTSGGAPGLTWVGLAPPADQGPFTSWLRMDPTNPDSYDDPTVGDYYEWS